MNKDKELRLTMLKGFILDEIRQWNHYQVLKHCFDNGYLLTEEYNSLMMYVDDSMEIDIKNIEKDDEE